MKKGIGLANDDDDVCCVGQLSCIIQVGQISKVIQSIREEIL